ncbi:type I site-specific deoxyribonuclease specificity subunit HsdS [Lactobacillus equicursoris DSM 19284 = JCM 14600 = CIP 110162]|uniref:Type I site-specific deoxyribonuclease specificity subunit HsdS n=2 Tax=Lactobacillus equicursoris TaxID=420645 RepID=A0A0R1M4M5_9LACO|nr:restriction endonuclease subunit S [Lactobacillus equicursoris]KRL02737.1 type I site-specific deoxyribonuclease specificity subunit HsdS [Lactobacillus equicursoris DSM 19284 = JCM 14600 = CIP 110162]
MVDLSEEVKGNDGVVDGLPILTISAANGWMNQKDRFSQVIAGSELKKYTLLKKGELSYNHGNSKLAKFGAVFELDSYKEALVPRVYHSFKMVNGNSPSFIEYLFATKRPDRELSKLITSGARMDGLLNINKKDFFGIKLKVPTPQEQTKISKLLRGLDRTITLHEEKQRQLEQLKKALLQKMFADKKEYPELRFNGFSDSWNKNKVSELFTITRGYVLPAKDTKPTPEGDYCYPVYSSQTAQNGLMGYYNKYLYKDAITWTTDGANAGTVRFRTGKFYCTNVCGVLLTKKAKASEMIAMALNKVTKKYVSYVGNPKLMNNVMGEIVISLPTNTEEQNNLSFLFNNLERAIILTEHKIEQLKSLKQALLQQMFI